jgi:membrane protein implicated in regulation of membrane protease activity
MLAALFLTGITSLTKLFTGLDALPFVAPWGGWISLVAFAIIAYVLIRLPLRKRSTSP